MQHILARTLCQLFFSKQSTLGIDLIEGVINAIPANLKRQLLLYKCLLKM